MRLGSTRRLLQYKYSSNPLLTSTQFISVFIRCREVKVSTWCLHDVLHRNEHHSVSIGERVPGCAPLGCNHVPFCIAYRELR